jgi:hypothetical protein
MKWMQLGEKEWGLVVLPLHGRGNKNGEGAPVKVLLYHKPDDVKAEWKSEVIDESMHATHNFYVVPGAHVNAFGINVGGREGFKLCVRTKSGWTGMQMTGPNGSPLGSLGVGEVRFGFFGASISLIPTIEPMHGNTLALYRYDIKRDKPGTGYRTVLTDKLIQGHALACADVLGTGGDQIIVGWRGNIPPKDGDKVGIAVWTALDNKGEQWRETLVDDNQTACEDLAVADLDADGKLDIIAAGRATHNLRILWNER